MTLLVLFFISFLLQESKVYSSTFVFEPTIDTLGATTDLKITLLFTETFDTTRDFTFTTDFDVRSSLKNAIPSTIVEFL